MIPTDVFNKLVDATLEFAKDKFRPEGVPDIGGVAILGYTASLVACAGKVTRANFLEAMGKAYDHARKVIDSAAEEN